MQDQVAHKLSSKHSPGVGRIAAFPLRIIADWARALPSRLTATAAATHPAPQAAKGLVPATPTLTRVYTGTMTLGGSFTDSQEQKGTWSGSLHEQLTVTVDANGNGSGFEIFSGTLGATVTNPDGSTKSIPQSAFGFTLPVFNIHGGHFSISQSDGNGLIGLQTTVTVSGTLNMSQPTASENLKIPFNGFVQGVLFDGSVTGSSSLSTPPLAISGAAARQTAYAAQKMSPFANLFVSDLNGVPVTATITLSNPTHGILTNLGGGKYNRGTGTYAITGSASTVNAAIEGLQFDAAHNGPSFPVPTVFTVKITDTKGSALLNRTTSVLSVNPLSIRGVVANQSVKATNTISPFRNVSITDLLGAEKDFVKITLSDAKNGALTNLGGGFYNKTTGVYVISGSVSQVATAVRGLVFDPSGTVGQATSFTISVKNAAGASVTNSKATVTAKTTVGLFSQYVAAGLNGTRALAAGVSALHDLPAPPHLLLAASHA